MDGGTLSFPTAHVFGDSDKDSLTYSSANLPGWLAIDPATGVVSTIGTIPASASASGPYTVTITARDPSGANVSTDVIINVTNPAPIATNDSSSKEAYQTQTGNVLTNDRDGANDSDAITVTQVSGMAAGVGVPVTLAYGDLTLNANGTWSFTPNAAGNSLPHGASMTESITYTITDANGAPAIATLSITVIGVNHAPELIAPLPAVNATDGGTITIPTAGSFKDIDKDGLMFTATGLPPGLVMDPNTGIITGTLAANASQRGPYVITITADDGLGGVVSTTFTIGVANLPVVAVNNSSSNTENTTQTGNVLANDHDTAPDNDPLTVTAVTGGRLGAPITLTYGDLVLEANGSWTFVPNAAANALPVGASRTETVTYTVTDGTDIRTAALTIEIIGSNDTPMASSDTGVVDQDRPLTFSVLGNDTDIDGDTLSIVAASADHGTVVINADGTLTLTPPPGFVGTIIVTYMISDGNGGFASAIATIEVRPEPRIGSMDVQQPPVFLPQTTYPSLSVDGAVLSTVRGISGLGGIANTFGDGGVILSVANQIRPLGGLSALTGPDGAITSTVLDVADLNRLESVLDFYGRGRPGETWDIKGLTGFSLRYNQAESVLGAALTREFSVESLIRDRQLIVNVQHLHPLNGRSIVDTRFMMAGGKPLAEWVDVKQGGLVLINWPVDVEQIDLRVVIVLSDGQVVEKDVRIDTVSGEIQPLIPGRRTELPRLFNDQFDVRGILPASQIEAVGRALMQRP